jgi:hypothetical protein
MATDRSPISSSRARAWTAVVLAILGVAALPAAIELARESQRVALLDAAYAIPVAFLLGVLATGMARRARKTIGWLRLEAGGTAVATTALALGVLAISLALTAALSVGVYEGVLYYQRHYR